MPLTRPLALLALLLMQLPAAAETTDDARWSHPPYELGQGLNFPQLGVNAGGYMSLRYRDVDNVESSFGVKDLSLLLSVDLGNRVNFFAEAEIGEAVSITRNGVNTDDAEFEFERLYIDYRARPDINLRLGKFLTPVGRWNLIHADPLVWTVSRPLTTAVSFARQATGAMVHGSLPHGDNGLDYSVFVDNTDVLDHEQKEESAYEDANSSLAVVGAFERAVGAHVTYNLPDARISIGASYLHYRMMDLREDKDLFGADVFWNLPRVELTGEWVYRNSRGGSEPDERGGFVQAAVPLVARVYGIARYEHYTAAVQPEHAEIHTLGLTYRPHRAVSLKLEHRAGERNGLVAPDGWLGSLAVLF